LNPIANVTINESAGTQTVNLSGISAGNPNQTVTITAASSNPSLIPTPVVNYTNPNSTGTLTFAPTAYANGTATITVTVNDGAASNNIVSQTFTVTVNAVNQAPTLNAIANLAIAQNTNQQTVALSGITSGAPNEIQTLKVTATSSNPNLIKPTVSYTSPNTTGAITFKPARNSYGVATITVTVNDGGTSNNVVSKSFTVTVLAPGQVATAATISPGSPATLTAQPIANGQFTFTVDGTAGSQYVVEASSDLVNWTPIQTNAAPFTVVDPNAATNPQQYYRAYLAQ